MYSEESDKFVDRVKNNSHNPGKRLQETGYPG